MLTVPRDSYPTGRGLPKKDEFHCIDCCFYYRSKPAKRNRMHTSEEMFGYSYVYNIPVSGTLYNIWLNGLRWHIEQETGESYLKLVALP